MIVLSYILFGAVSIFFFLYIKRIRLSVSKINEAYKLLQSENESIKADLKLKDSLLDELPYPIWVKRKDSTITYFNNKFANFISLNTQDIHNSAVDINTAEYNLTRKAVTSRKTCSDEIYTIVDQDRYLYKFHATPLIDNTHVLVTAHDVSDKIQIKNDLEKYIVTQECLLESTGTAIAIYNVDTKLKFFNQAFSNLWKLDKEWLLNQPTYRELLEQLRDQRKIPEQIDFSIFIKEQLKLFTTITSTHNEFIHLPNGKTLRILMIPHALGGVLFSYEDITDKVALERSYKILTKVQKETLDHINDGITVFSESGKLEISNTKFTQLWNLDDEVTNDNPQMQCILDKMYPMLSKKIADKKTLHELFLKNINSRKTKNIRLNRNDDSCIEALFVPLFNGATLISYNDITDSALIEKNLIERAHELKEADTMKTAFLANISYELRTPLMSIMGFSEALLNRYIGQLTDKQLTYIKDIYTASTYLANLINNVMDLAAIDAGNMKLNLSKFDIVEIIKPIVELLRKKIEGRNLTLKIDIKEDIDTMIGDVNKIKQIIFNLLNNAIIYSSSKRSVNLKVHRTNSNIIVCVEDDGKGIEKKHHSCIFNRSYKVNSNSPLSNTGLRFGLILIKSFVELHGGRIDLQSHVRKGNVVKCIFPLNNKELLAQYTRQQKILESLHE
ncbi:MAG: PAS-domain containing protein [Rickettsiales bacterium]|nr:PAS-domain containing protein [Rickettsiales bacterium]